MNENIKFGLKAIWLILITYWIVSGFFTKIATRQEKTIISFFYYWFPLIIAVLLLGPGYWFGRSWLREQFIDHTDSVGIFGLILSLIGGIIACWARYQLGKNWSLSVQQKEKHELIRTGLYKKVRHPIYSGLLLLFTGTAIIVGDYRSIVATVIVFLSFWFKLKKEERLLFETFGEKYKLYKKETHAIIPYII